MSASSSPFSPVWRQKSRLDDALFARAYEALNGKERALLKLCIARLHRVLGVSALFEARTARFAEGFGLRADEAPADWALLVCAADSPSPAALLAALLPAVLAGVEDVLVCFAPVAGKIAPEDVHPPLLAALELAGVEEACLAPVPDLAGALAAFAQSGDGAPGKGRVVCLGRAGDFSHLALACLEADIPFRLLPACPAYFSLRLDAVACQRFAGGGADRRSPGAFPDASPDRPVGAFPDAPVDAAPYPSPYAEDAVQLALDQAHEGVWIWPDLGPDWFRRKRLKLFTLPPDKRR